MVEQHKHLDLEFLVHVNRDDLVMDKIDVLEYLVVQLFPNRNLLDDQHVSLKRLLELLLMLPFQLDSFLFLFLLLFLLIERKVNEKFFHHEQKKKKKRISGCHSHSIVEMKMLTEEKRNDSIWENLFLFRFTFSFESI